MTARPTYPRSAGIALPWVLVTLTILSLLAATGFLLVWLDGRAAHAFSRGTAALYVAEAGLATGLAGAAGPTPTLPPLVFPTGTAHVSFQKLLELGPGESIVRIRSEGRVPSAGATYRRAVARLAWVADPPRVPAALSARGSVVGSPPRARISGLAPGSACPGQAAPTAGIASWGGSAPPASASFQVLGAPPTVRPPGSVAAETGIRWPELLAPWGPAADATIPPDPWPSRGTTPAWPYLRVQGPVRLGAGRSGRGALVVDGDLTLDPGFAWDGLVLVGGALRLGGDVRIRGAALAGLAGTAAIAVDLGGWFLDLELDPCAVAAAAARLVAPAAGIPGTWSEVWW